MLSENGKKYEANDLVKVLGKEIRALLKKPSALMARPRGGRKWRRRCCLGQRFNTSVYQYSKD